MSKKKRRARARAYVSPALPQFETSSPILAMVATAFFAPHLTLDEAAKLTKRVR